MIQDIGIMAEQEQRMTATLGMAKFWSPSLQGFHVAIVVERLPSMFVALYWNLGEHLPCFLSFIGLRAESRIDCSWFGRSSLSQ